MANTEHWGVWGGGSKFTSKQTKKMYVIYLQWHLRVNKQAYNFVCRSLAKYEIDRRKTKNFEVGNLCVLVPTPNWQLRGCITFHSIVIKQTNFPSVSDYVFVCFRSAEEKKKCVRHLLSMVLHSKEICEFLKRDQWCLPWCHPTVLSVS